MASVTEKLTDEEMAAGRKAIQEEGLSKVADRIGIHEQTVKSVVGGFPGRRLTVKEVRQYLTNRANVRL